MRYLICKLLSKLSRNKGGVMKPIRIQGTLVTDETGTYIERVTREYIRKVE